MRGTVLGIALAGLLVLSGCTGPSGPPVEPRTVPESAPSEAGDGDYELGLRVREAGGSPVPNAAVVVYWGSRSDEIDGGIAVGDVEGGPEGGSVHGVVRVDDPTTPEPSTTLSMRTDENGRVTAHAPTNRVVGIVAWAPNYTEEWIPRAVTGADGAGGTVDFPLYRARLVDDVNGTIGPAGASPGKLTGTNHDWYPQPAPWGEDEDARAGYVERLASARLTLTWTNGPDGGGGGDLSIGVGATTSEPDLVYDSDNPDAGPGEHTEQVALDTGDVEREGWPSSDRLFVGPATSSAYAGPTGLSYDLRVEAAFSPFASARSDEFSGHGAPGPAAGALAALAAAALALRRRTGAT